MRPLVRGLAAAVVLSGVLLVSAHNVVNADLINRNSNTVRIGVILPLSGTFAYAATEIDNGIKTYVRQFGEAVAGKRLEFFRKDTGSMDGNAIRQYAHDLVSRDRVDVFAGFMTSRDALAIAPVATAGRKLMVVMNATVSGLTSRSPYMVRIASTSAQIAEPFGTWAATKGGIKTCYTLVTDMPSGRDFEAAFSRGFKEAGGNIVGAVHVPLTESDLSAQVRRIKEVNPQAVMVYVSPRSPEQAAALARALAEHGILRAKIKVLGSGENTSDESLKAMGDPSLGMITAWHYEYTNDLPRNRAFVKVFNEIYGYSPNFLAANGYDGMHLIYQALTRARGQVDGDKLVEAVKGLGWDSPRGPVSIDRETRDTVQTIYLRKVESTNSGLRNVTFDKIENVKDPVKPRIR